MRLWHALALLAAVFLTYANSLRAPFLFDDSDAIVRNESVHRLGWQAFNPPQDGSATTARPIVNASFALNYALSGDNPWSYRLTNILIHGLAAITLMALIRPVIAR